MHCSSLADWMIFCLTKKYTTALDLVIAWKHFVTANYCSVMSLTYQVAQLMYGDHAAHVYLFSSVG